MVFYKGALQYETLMAMPMDKLIDLNDDADKMIKEAERKAKNGV